jgi:hypothetical protein
MCIKEPGNFISRFNPLVWAQATVLMLLLATVVLIGANLIWPLCLPAPDPPDVKTLASASSPEEIHARTELFTARENAARDDETFRRGYVITAILLPALDSLLKALAIVVVIRGAPAAINAMSASIRSHALPLPAIGTAPAPGTSPNQTRPLGSGKPTGPGN